MRRYILDVSLVLSLIVGFIGCDDPVKDDHMPVGGVIEIVSPKAGDSYKVGETVTISFKVDVSQVAGCVPQVSIDGGKTWATIGSQILPTVTSGGELLSYTWVIGSEDEPVDYVGTMTDCKIKVYEYNTFENDQSDAFTVSE